MSGSASATDRSVLDRSVTARVNDESIHLQFRLGRHKAGTFEFPLELWDRASHRYGNPHAGRIEYLWHLMMVGTHPYTQSFHFRLATSAYYAITAALAKREAAPVEIAS